MNSFSQESDPGNLLTLSVTIHSSTQLLAFQFKEKKSKKEEAKFLTKLKGQ